MANIVPEHLKYTKDHEWAKPIGDLIVIGITDFAQSALGDIVFAELPQIGTNLKAHQTFGVIESIKSVSDLYSPISGSVIEVNSDLTSAPEKCNTSPYEEAWMIKIKPSKPKEFDELLTSQQYSQYISTL